MSMRTIFVLATSKEPLRVQSLLERRYPGARISRLGQQMTIAISQEVQQSKPTGELERMIAEGALENCDVDWRIIAA